MKHRKLMVQMLGEWREPWMEDVDFDAACERCAKDMGEQFDSLIDKWVDAGLPLEKQIPIMRGIFKQLFQPLNARN